MILTAHDPGLAVFLAETPEAEPSLAFSLSILGLSLAAFLSMVVFA